MPVTKVTPTATPITNHDDVTDAQVRRRSESERPAGVTPVGGENEGDKAGRSKTVSEGVLNEAFLNDETKRIPYGSFDSGQASSTTKVIANADDYDLIPQANANGHHGGLDSKDAATLEGNNQGKGEDTSPRVYFRRWFMLALFCMYSFSSAFQWIHLNIISNIITEYYNQSLPTDSYEQFVAVDMLSMIYMIMYIPFIFPATWLLDKKGLRISCIIGSLINAVGAWLKCASVSGDRFAVLMTAQTISALAQNFVLGIPPRLAAVWFGPNEVSTATSIGVFGNQVGVAIGFLVPPIIVKNSGNQSQMTDELNIMIYTTAAFTTIVFVLILIFFKNTPPHPPSRAQQLIVDAAAHENYLQSLKSLLTNRGFFILTVAYGINTGSFYGISTLLNAVVIHYFEGREEDAGRIGLTLVLMGVVGAILGGIWLDRTKKFKSTTIGIYILSLLGMVAFTFTLDLKEIWVVYITAGSLGFFMTGYLPVGFEFAAEITYPSSEGTSSGLLNCSAQIFGIIFTMGMRALLNSVSVLGANITVCVALLLGSILTSFIKADYRRQAAGKEAMKVLVQEADITAVTNDDHNRLTKAT